MHVLMYIMLGQQGMGRARSGARELSVACWHGFPRDSELFSAVCCARGVEFYLAAEGLGMQNDPRPGPHGAVMKPGPRAPELRSGADVDGQRADFGGPKTVTKNGRRLLRRPYGAPDSGTQNADLETSRPAQKGHRSGPQKRPVGGLWPASGVPAMHSPPPESGRRKSHAGDVDCGLSAKCMELLAGLIACMLVSRLTMQHELTS